MLFERIRRTQKPIFVFLAVTFAMGFVLLGVGQGAGSINALDFLTGGSSSSDPTSTLKDQVTKNPKDAAAWQKLAVEYPEPGQERRRDQRLRAYLSLKKDDPTALSSVAGLLETARLPQPAERVHLRRGGPVLLHQSRRTVLNGLKATSLATDPVATAAGSQYQALATNYSSQSSTDVQVALGYRQTLAKLQPEESPEPARTGLRRRQRPSVRGRRHGPQEYLKLAPDSQQAAQVKSLVKELQALAASPVPGQ